MVRIIELIDNFKMNHGIVDGKPKCVQMRITKFSLVYVRLAGQE